MSPTGSAETSSAPEEAAPLAPWRMAVLAPLAAFIAVVHIYFNLGAGLSDLHVSALHFGLFGLFCALSMPSLGERLAGRILDGLIGASALGVAFYLVFAEAALYERGSAFVWSDWLAAGLAIALALEFARRTTGWFIPVLTLLALTYVVVWGDWIRGVFNFPGLSWETLFYRAYFGTEGLFGTIANISWSFVFMFILFGTFLVRSGAGDFIIDLARLAAGRITGGPGFVAILSSGLMGSVTGSAVANTVSTGVITIPLMRRAGFQPRFAAGVEAAASTGGQIMPPVMGAGAFVMATFTQISYLEIIAAATVPALIYFLSVALFVRIEARRAGLSPVPDPDLAWAPVLRRGWQFLLPLALLVSLLVVGFTPSYAAGFATLSVIAASWLSPTPMGLRSIYDSCFAAARTMTTTAMLLITVGLIVMVIGTTGVGNTLSLMINSWAGGSLFVTLVLVALASLILGMGLPVTAAYIVLAALSAPVLYGLMVDGQLAQMVAGGAVPEAMRGILMISVPDAAARIGTPMPLDEARALIATIPPELAVTLRDTALDPALLAASLLSAHMIIFWLSQDSNVTPPVCLAAFAAAGLAKSPPMATGVTAWRLAKGLYIVPFLLAYTPLIGGRGWRIAWIAVTGLAGLYALAGVLEAYLEGPLTLPLRIASGVLGVILLWPGLTAWVVLPALAGLMALVAWTRYRPAENGLANAST